MKRRLATAVVAAGFLALTPAAALAYAPSPSVSVSAGVVAVGESVVFAGDGFAPDSSVVVAVAEGDSSPFVLGEALVDGAGAFSVEIDFDEPGSYTLIASGLDADGQERTLTQNVRVTGEGSGSGSEDGSGSGNESGGASMHGGSGSGTSRSAERTVVSTSSRNGGELAHTGIDSLGLQVGAAAALVVVGGAAAGATAVRRRRVGA